jgi:hypothetical protein
LLQFPQFNWVPVNEGAKSWGYKPFYAVVKILDTYCLDLYSGTQGESKKP